MQEYTLNFRKHDIIFKYIIQNCLQDLKINIIEVPNLQSFGNYLEFAKIINEQIINKILCPIKSAVYSYFYLFVKDSSLCYSTKLFTFYRKINETISHYNKINNSKINHSIIQYFIKMQKTYFALVKFSYICKNKITKNLIDYDLLMNPINFNKSIKIHSKGCAYVFSINDVYNLFMNNICYHDDLFITMPKKIKNPYNGVKFSLCDLYNMFFFIKKKYYLQNKLYLIDLFFRSNFKLNTFGNNYDSLITNFNIDKFIKNNPLQSIFPYIREFINFVNSNILNKKKKDKLNYCKHFPKKVYCKVFRPYLKLFLSYRHNPDNNIQHISFLTLKRKIIRFVKASPKFGKTTFKLEKQINSNCRKTIKIYETKHIDYYKNDMNYLDIQRSNFKDWNFQENNNNVYSEDNSMVYSDSDTNSDDDSVNVILNNFNNFTINPSNPSNPSNTSNPSEQRLDQEATIDPETFQETSQDQRIRIEVQEYIATLLQNRYLEATPVIEGIINNYTALNTSNNDLSNNDLLNNDLSNND